MKFLTDRTEIAKKINIERVPVITMNIRKCMDGYEDCYEGTKINIDGAHKGRYADLLTHCTAMMFGDEEGNKEHHDAPWLYKRIHLRPRMTCIHSDFSLRDVDEMVDWMSAPIARPNDEVIVFFRDEKKGFLRLMKIPTRIDPHCSTACILEDVE